MKAGRPLSIVLVLLFLAALVGTFSTFQPGNLSSLKSEISPNTASHQDGAYGLSTHGQSSVRKSFSGSVPFQPSIQARRSFPAGKVLDARIDQVAANHFRRIELIETSLKYKYIRLETEFRREGTNEVLLARNEVVADHVVLELQAGATENQLSEILTPIDATILRKLQVEGAATYLAHLPEPALDMVPDTIRTLSGFTNVIAAVDGDGVSHKTIVANDPRFPSQWHLNNTAQLGGYTDSDIDLVEAWSIHTGNPAILVATSDTGVDFRHSDLKANLWTNVLERPNGSDDDNNGYKDDARGWNFYDGNNNVDDMDGHGTFVAGIIGAEGNNSQGISGVAWRCKILPVRSLDSDGGFASDIAEGFDYARKHGAKVINASHGGASSVVLKSAVDRLQAAGILLVAAAGNSGEDTDSIPLYPASYPNPNIISVAASSNTDTLATFSSYGATTVDLTAPGVKILSTERQNTYTVYSGTSFAVPQVVGVAALVLSQNPAQTALQVRARILNSVDYIPDLEGVCVTAGRLNAYKALLPRTSFVSALEHGFLQWTTGGNVPWIAGNSPFSKDALDSAETGKVWHGGESWLGCPVMGPGSVSFSWKVSSELNHDYLAFYVDGVERKRISGQREWMTDTFEFGGGEHTLMWIYRRDGSSTSGSDKGFLDQVVFRGPPPQITAQPSSLSVKAGSPASFQVSASGMAPFGYQWRKNGVDIAGATRSSFTISSVTPTNAGNYSVLVKNAGGTTASSAGNLKLCTVSLPGSGVTLNYQAASNTLAVTTVGNCPWAVQTTNSWITLDSGSLVEGPTTYQFSVSENASPYPRLGVITVGAVRFLVKQLGVSAPVDLNARVFSMTITNSADSSVTNGSFVFNTSSDTITNRFNLLSFATNVVASDAGPFEYERFDDASGYLTLNGNASSELAMTFDSPVRGRFAYEQQGSSNTLHGIFSTREQGLDFNDDSYTDLVWQTPQGLLMGWCMQGVKYLKTVSLRNRQALPPGWQAVTCAEFFQRGEMDLIVQHTNRRIAALSLSPGTNYGGFKYLRGDVVVGTGWKAITSADFNHDGKKDILFQHSNTSLLVWFMDGTNYLGAHFLRKETRVGAGWRLVGAVDFDQDTSADLLFQHQDGRLQAWTFLKTDFVAAKLLTRPTVGWKALALGDYNNDSKPDILFQTSEGKLAVWFMNNLALSKAQLMNNGTPAPVGWRLVGPR